MASETKNAYTKSEKISLNLLNRIKDLYIHQKHTDCTFIVDGTKIQGHKIILSAASPVFEAMFYGPMSSAQRKSSNECDIQSDVIQITDIDSEIFEMMLEYIYTDEITWYCQSIEHIMKLYYCSEKYLINGLGKKCISEITKNLRYTNILRAMDLAIYFDIKPLLVVCSNVFLNGCLLNRDFHQSLETDYYHVTKECLNFILGCCQIEQQYTNLMVLLRKWYQTETKMLGVDDTDEDVKLILEGLQISDGVSKEMTNIMVLPHKFSSTTEVNDSNCNESNIRWTNCHRHRYKAVRPLLIENDDNQFVTVIRPDRFIAIKSLTLNSRLPPPITQTIRSNLPRTYTETLTLLVETRQEYYYKHTFVVPNVKYNSNVQLSMPQPLVLQPDCTYSFTFKWDSYDTANVRYEYPQNIFEKFEIVDGYCRIVFDDDDSRSEHINGLVSILNGLELMVLNNCVDD